MRRIAISMAVVLICDAAGGTVTTLVSRPPA
jgi:hypothetical protein